MHHCDELLDEQIASSDSEVRTSVVVAYKNADRRLLLCLQAIERNQPKPDQILALSGGGHADDVQRGVELADGEIVLFTDSDTYVPPDWIAQHLRHYPENEMVLGWTAYNLRSLALRNFSAKRSFLLQFGFRAGRWKENFDTDFAIRAGQHGRYIVDRRIRVRHDDPRGDLFGQRILRKIRVGMILIKRGELPTLEDISYFMQTPIERFFRK